MKTYSLSLCLSFVFACSLHAQNLIIPFNATWKFIDNGTNQGTAWRSVSFNDVSWSTGTGKFGFGINDANTVISFGPDRKKKYITTYFRKTISLLSQSDFPNLASIKRDDGAVVYINGTEVYRNNMPTGTISSTTLASTGAIDNGSTAETFAINSSLFLIGNNTIAVEIHQQKTNSSENDMAFDFNLQRDNNPPVVMSVNRQSPTTNSTNATLVTFRCIFSEPVNGVNATDFSLTNTGALSGTISLATAISQSVYDITVNNITGSGTMRLDLKSSATGITDIAGNTIPTGFTDGQTYTILQTSPTLTTVSIASNNSTTSLAKTGNTISLSFTASETINTPEVTIATHPVGVSVGIGNSFIATYTVVNSDVSGLIPFTINFTNTAGIPGNTVTATTNGSSVTFDKTLPIVVSINRHSPLSSSTNVASVIFRATFSEPVTGVDNTDFLPVSVNGAISSIVSTVVVSSNSVYDISVNSITGTGSLRLDLKTSGTGINDIVGNSISGGFTAGQTYTFGGGTSLTGFTSIIPLSSIDISRATKDKPQAKAWFYANQWWCALSGSAGTTIYRLDGTNWTNILTLTNRFSKTDCWVSGNLVHILGVKLADSFIYTVEYDPSTNTYKLWNLRPASSVLFLPEGQETATIVVDGAGRMWVAAAGTTEVTTWWSDSPYTTWSAPITIASGINDDDICALAVIPNQNKIGIFWSNQNTQRFGFKTHVDGSVPGNWSGDEVPASQSAVNIGRGMADDHVSIIVTNDGTLYCASKTGYDRTGYPQLILLIRRPSGTWDDLHTVTMYPEGTQSTLILNEVQGKVKVIYTTQTNGGNIVYRESSTTNISFGAQLPLISSATFLYNYATSSHQSYNPGVVIIASDEFSVPMKAVSVLASDASALPKVSRSVSPSAVIGLPEMSPNKNDCLLLRANPNPFSSVTKLNFQLNKSGYYSILVYDSQGKELYTFERGWSEAGKENIRDVNMASLQSGLYMVSIKTYDGIASIKIVKH